LSGKGVAALADARLVENPLRASIQVRKEVLLSEISHLYRV